MPSLKVIRKRIASVRNTQQITKAMKMVSAAKLRRAQEALVTARPYAGKLVDLLSSVAAAVPEEAHPLLRQSAEPAKTRLIVLTGDRGLCGAYNGGILRQADARLRTDAEKGMVLTVVGRKGVEHFHRRRREVTERHSQATTPAVSVARAIAVQVAAEFAEGRVDKVEILYSAFRSALSQVPTFETLLPLSLEKIAGKEAPQEYLMEPDRVTLLDRLLPQYVEMRILRALLEAAASEHGARMTAMDSATSNASKMIFSLTLAMNRARQDAITRELMEIVSGAEALKG